MPEARHAAVLGMSRIAVSASEVDPEMTTEIAAALGSLTLDADPHVATAAQTELERLVTRGAGPAPTPQPPADSPPEPERRRPWLGWAVAGLIAVAAVVLGVALLTDRLGPDVTVTTASTVTVTTPEVQTTELPPDGIWPDGQNWIDSGVVLAAGDQVLIEAEGEATHDGTDPYGPDGDPRPEEKGANLPELARKRTTTRWWDVSVRTTRRSWSANSSHSPPTTREPCISVSTTWVWRTTRASTSSTSPLPDRDQPAADGGGELQDGRLHFGTAAAALHRDGVDDVEVSDDDLELGPDIVGLKRLVADAGYVGHPAPVLLESGLDPIPNPWKARSGRPRRSGPDRRRG